MQAPDMITFHCPSCSMKLQVPAQMAGITGPCPQCSASITAPHPSAQPAAAAPIAAAPLPKQQVQQPIQQSVQQQAPAAQSTQQQQQSVAQNPQQPRQQAEAPQAREIPAVRAERPSAERPAQESPVARERARQRAAQPEQKPKPRARWMRVIFPLAFLIVAAALVLAVLQAVGVFNVWDYETSKKELISSKPDNSPSDTPSTTGNGDQPSTDHTSGDVAPSVTPDGETPSKNDPEDPTVPVIKNTPEDGEFPELKLPTAPADTTSPDTGTGSTPPTPPVTPPPSPPAPPDTTATNPSITPATAPQDNTPPSPPKAGFLANQNLNMFLAAKTLDERMALMSKSKHTREELMASCLAGPLKAVKSVRMVEMVPRVEDNMTQYLYFVSFEDPEEDQQRQRIVMQVVERPGIHPPRVHADAFIEHYEKKFTQYAKHPNNKVTTFHCIAESRMAALSKELPKKLRESMVRLVIKSHPRGPSMFDAYLNKNSPLMEHIGTRKDFPYTEPRFCVLSFRWNTTEPNHPYIELNDIVSQGWER